jgi:hypothetical protein
MHAGFIEIEGERKFTRDFRRGAVSIDFYEAAGCPLSGIDFSQLRIHYAGRKIFVIRWRGSGDFKIVVFEPGDWERTLRAWPAPDRIRVTIRV